MSGWAVRGMSWAETGHGARGTRPLGAAGRQASRNLAPRNHCEVRAGPGEARRRQAQSPQRLFSRQSWVCKGHREAEGGPTELWLEKGLGLKRLPGSGQ